jgi:hypothetical protein
VYPGADNASLAAASITLQLDGKPVTSFRFQDQDIVFVPPEPLANGSHQYCLAARNSNGNISPRQCASFTVALPPRQITVTPLLPVIPADGTAWTPLTIAVYDELQRPVADGTRVSLSATAGRLDNSTLATFGGRAQTLLRSDTTQGQVTVQAKAGAAAGSGNICFGVPDDGLLLVRVQGPAGKPIPDAALLSNDRQIAVSDSAGFVHDRGVSAGQAAYRIYKKGYVPSCISASLAPGTLTTQTVVLAPVDSGVLFDRVIMLDPAGASAASRPVMSSLAARIENAGGTAVSSWTEPPAPSDTARALRAGQANADIFLRFEMTKKQLSVRYYYKSPQGEDLAAQIARNLNSRAPVQKKKWVTAAGTDYVLAHTAMPAVIIALPEKALRAADEVAQSIYDALREQGRK